MSSPLAPIFGFATTTAILSSTGSSGFCLILRSERRRTWYNSVLNLTQTKYIDGVFVDGCAKGVPNTTADRQVGKIAMLKRLQRDVPGPIICGSNGELEDGLAGSQIQNWGKGESRSTREIPMLQRAVEKGVLFQAHGKCPKDLADPHTISNLAAFLVAAGPYSYYVCGGWNSASTEWFEAYNKPLGEPLGDAVLSDAGVWSRSFKHGVHVSFDTNTEEGSITWSSAMSV